MAENRVGGLAKIAAHAYAAAHVEAIRSFLRGHTRPRGSHDGYHYQQYAA